MHAIAYVQDNRLCIWGVKESAKLGPIPFSHSVTVENQPNGPVDLAEPNEVIKAALEESQKVIMSGVQREAMVRAAGELVERARVGDQNAMGMLSMIAQNAKKGIGRAQVSAKLIQKYIKKHPVLQSSIGAELVEQPRALMVARTVSTAIQTEDLMQYASAVIGMLSSITQEGPCAAVTLANGPDIYEGAPNHRISAIHDLLKDESQQASFTFGVKNQGGLAELAQSIGTLEPEDSRAFWLGKCVNLARKIQGIRRPEVPISTLSTMAAWELGEE